MAAADFILRSRSIKTKTLLLILMTTYIALLNFTPQGLQNVHESPHRAAAFKAAAKKAGVKVRDIYWTLGAYDGVLIFDAETDKTATAATLALSGLGNVHTQTLRTFSAMEFTEILEKSPRL
jgi:uncharacterized protein with GYD domain